MAKIQSDKAFRLRVITPTETKIDRPVNMVIMRCLDGDMGIMHGHQPYLCVLDIGVLRIQSGNKERKLAVFGGIAEVYPDEVVIVTDEAHWPRDIDKDRAEEARAHLERVIQEKTGDRELALDQILLRRALVQIEVGSLPLDSEEDE